MAKSKIMQLSKKKEAGIYKKLTPSEKLMMAVELSDFCMELKKAGEKAGRYGINKKSKINR